MTLRTRDRHLVAAAVLLDLYLRDKIVTRQVQTCGQADQIDALGCLDLVRELSSCSDLSVTHKQRKHESPG